MEKVEWKIDGMTCTNCAMSINQYLKKQGAENIAVSVIDGDVSFDITNKATVSKLAQGIEALGYKVQADVTTPTVAKKKLLANNLSRFFFCLPFTVLLLLHMIPALHLHFLMNGWAQLLITLPVYATGLLFFGRSAFKSILNGMPNMNVLICIGATAAFAYSLYGTVFNLGDSFLFYETTAATITLVFFGNYLEDVAVQSTRSSLKKLARNQKVMANMIAFDENHKEVIFPVESDQLRTGDLLLIKNGEQVPADGKILSGDAFADESLLTGESLPIAKSARDMVIGGSIIVQGIIKIQVTAAGKDTVLSKIIDLVKKAEAEKPPVQKLADKISAVFVPVVTGIAFLTFLINWFITKEFSTSLLRSIAVLVISCPCAMGLATPAAIAVGMGRAARAGILFRDSKILELFSKIKTIVFDKTGTLTTGKFKIQATSVSIDLEEFKLIVFSLEKYSNHPIAKSITSQWNQKNAIRWKTIREIKGKGVEGSDAAGDLYWCGSELNPGTINSKVHSVYVYKNSALIGWIEMEDELRPESMEVIQYFKRKGFKTILLSGDSKSKSHELAEKVGINEVIAEKTPEEKLHIVEQLNSIEPTIMVGDGINDAAALSKATVGISMSEASQIAIQSAQVVLVNSGLQKLAFAVGIGNETYRTIKQNLAWAFLYNIIAIPVAASGLLGQFAPSYGALFMALSDVVLIINSSWLLMKKVV
ncbi:MAG TPA: cation-translocating P-type ATPase [Flavisolibacter sp.]|nr:cation-translocating P-type ATPase [Flavisolibacter sp.]